MRTLRPNPGRGVCPGSTPSHRPAPWGQAIDNGARLKPRLASRDPWCTWIPSCGRRGLILPGTGPGPPTTLRGARTLTTLCEAGRPWRLVHVVLHGEFDPGSGRTLAACLTHASGATNQASAWGKAANG